jgi:hypothetical protein
LFKRPHVALSESVSKAAGISQWKQIEGGNYAVGEFTTQLWGWKKPRRFIAVRERVREKKMAVGRKLLEVPGYTFRIFVTNRDEDPLSLWRDYNGRAVIEQRIEELKAELAADGFCSEGLLRHRIGVPGGALHFQSAESLPEGHRTQGPLPAASDATKRRVFGRGHPRHGSPKGGPPFVHRMGRLRKT